MTTDAEDEYMHLPGGDLAKIAALVAIRAGYSHDEEHRKKLDALIQAGVNLVFPKVPR